MIQQPPEIFEEMGSKLLAEKFNNMENFDLGKSLWYRFLRGAIAGAVSAGVTVTFSGTHTFSDLRSTLTTMGIMLITGAITGAFLAVDKFIRV